MWLAKQVGFLIYQVKYFRCCHCCCLWYRNCRFNVEIQASEHRLGASMFPAHVLHFCSAITTAWWSVSRVHLEKSPKKRRRWREEMCLFVTLKWRVCSNLCGFTLRKRKNKLHPTARCLWTALLFKFLPKPVRDKRKWWGPAWKAFRFAFF